MRPGSHRLAMHLITFELSTRHASATTGRGSVPTAAARFTDAALGFESLDLLRPGICRLGAVMPPGPHAGVVVDLNRALAVRLATEDVGAPEAEADSLLPADMSALLAAGESGLAMARHAFAWTLEYLDHFDLELGDVVLSRRRVRPLAPLPRPGKLIGAAGNYAARGADAPSEPTLFVKASSSVIGPGDDIVLPAASHAVDYEGQLGAVIGRAARGVDAESALEHVAGFTVANDVTARDFQNARGQDYIGKSCDTFAPLGPWLVTRDEIDDPQKLALTTRVNGEVRQLASTAEMIFPVAELIAFASRLMTLEPGDVILTGTPAGVDAANGPPRHLADGDFVEVEIEGVGLLRNHVRAERRPRNSSG